MQITELTAEQLKLEGSGLARVLLGSALFVGAIIWTIALWDDAEYFAWGAIPAIGGLVLISVSSWIKISANKVSGKILHQQKGLFNKSESTIEIADVAAVLVGWNWAAQTMQEASNSAPKLVTKVIMLLKDGATLVLANNRTADESEISAFVGGKGEQYEFAGKIAQFLNVTVQELKL